MNLPTKITTARLVMIPLIVVCYILQPLWRYAFAFTWLLYAIASMTDFVDGYLARKYNMVTSVGKFLDPIADKVLVLTGLAIILDADYIGIPYLGMVFLVVILARELIIGLFRQIAALGNCVLAADNLGKAKTITTLLGMGFLLFVPVGGVADTDTYRMFSLTVRYIGIGMMILATVLTVVSGVNYIVKNKAVLVKKEEEKAE